MISLRSDNEPLVITNLRYYNWKLEPAERAYDAATDVVRLPAADRRKRGLVVSITADDFAVGDTVQITAGPLEGFMGLVEAIDTENFKVKLKVNMFGRETPAEVEIGQVELP